MTIVTFAVLGLLTQPLAWDAASLQQAMEKELGKVLSPAEVTDLGTISDPMDISADQDDQVVYPVELGATYPALGPADAPVTMVVFSDFQCPYCADHEENLLKVREEYGDLVRLVFKHYPLSFHDQARPAALAAEAARVQGKFWEMHRALFANQRTLGPALFESLASDLGLAVSRFKEDIKAPRLAARVDEDIALGGRCKLSGTPSTYINGFLVSGAVSPAKLRRHISLALARSFILLRRGVKPADLYTFSIHPESLPGPAAPARAGTAGSKPPRFPQGFSWDEDGFWYPVSVRSGLAIQPPQKP